MKNRIDYNKVMSQVRQIENNITQLNSQISQLKALESDSKSGWKGTAADAFRGKLRELINEMQATKSEMSKLARKIKSVASNIKAADDRLADQTARLRKVSALGGSSGSHYF